MAVLLLACAVSAQVDDPFKYYPFTNIQPPVQETPEVRAARLSHLAEHNKARGLPPPEGGPAQDTAEVLNAKVEFYRAYAAAAAANGVVSNLPPLPGMPIANVVADTPEVAAAKAAFFRSYNEAAARSG